jgi:uncharacterized membrane protein
MAAAVLAAVGLQLIAPRAGKVSVWWIAPAVEVLMLGILIARDPGRIDERSRTLRNQTIALFTLITLATMGSAVVLLIEILDETKGISAGALLGRGASQWVTNVIVFSLWFWEFDRGGAAERAAGSGIPPSFVFPEDATPELAPAGWIPSYPDYLYLAFTNATAFSPTDTVPIRLWAKMAMMLESAISLVIAIMVVARAVNVLPD